MKKDKNGDSKTNLKGGATIDSDKKEDEEGDFSKPEEVMIQTTELDDAVTHKKKRKRNVESRDVWT